MDIEETSLLSMYLNFRRYLDCICFENLVKMSGDGFIKIKHNENTVGFLMIIDDYIDAIYVLPEYRRLGLARKAVLDAWNSGIKMRTLHIVNGNTIAEKFWNSIFRLTLQHVNLVDSFYYINGLK